MGRPVRYDPANMMLTQAAMIYPTSGPVTLKTHLVDSPLVAALKSGKVSSPVVTFDFCGPPVAQDGFKRMVQQNEFDAGELAIVTYLQARTYGKPYTALPAVIAANFQHGSISYIHRGETLHPKDMEGRKVAVRSYSQTGPTWARGVLQHEYGVDLSRVTWITTDAPHVPEYEEPNNVVRVDRNEKSLDQRMIDGEADFGLLGANAPKHPGARRLIPDHEDAAAAWCAKYRCVPINHIFVVRSELAAERPDVVDEIWRLLCESKQAAGLIAGKIDSLPFGLDEIAKPVSLVNQYAHEQKLIPKPFGVEDLFERPLGA